MALITRLIIQFIKFWLLVYAKLALNIKFAVNFTIKLMEEILTQYKLAFGKQPESCSALTAQGSSRQYFRLTGPANVIGTLGSDIRENRAFIHLSNLLSSKGLPVPRVSAVSADGLCYFQDDLGDISLYDLISNRGLSDPELNNLLSKTMHILASVHTADLSGMDWSVCFPRPEMDRRAILWDLNYFKYCFLKPTGIEFDEEKLENEFQYLCSLIESQPLRGLMLRDFQSRNIMIHNHEPWIIDFQGARKGPQLYDLASFLWQARIALPDDLRMELAEGYICELRARGKVIDGHWKRNLHIMALFRMLQVLGAYGFRGLQQHKAQFVTSIPAALQNAISLLNSLSDSNLSYIGSLISRVAKLPHFLHQEKSGKLKVKVYSFSYKKGIPEDFSGNGGGFVFDCRAVHNPGRYDEYKQLTGRDKPVIDFLERDGEILDFLRSCAELVDRSVARYIKRGFTDLSVSFGCTGGRHRSVYSAEWMAHHIVDNFECDVQLIHRERGVTEYLKH